MSIRLITLGQFSVLRDGVEETTILSWKRRLALLAYLGVEGKATRDQLTTLFWPEKDPEKARHSLSQALYEIRQACGSDCLQSHGEWISATSSLEVDAAAFRAFAEEGRYQEALEQYGGEFLPGTHLVPTPEFQQWVGRVQAQLRRLHRASRDAVIRVYLESEDREAALQAARKWVELEPLEDEAQHRFIQLLALAGRRSEALLQFEEFERALAQDGLEPLDDTKTLIEKIRRKKETGALANLEPLSLERVEVEPEPTGEEGGEERPWIVELADTLKDWWVFRGLLAYFTAAAFTLGIADAVGVPETLIKKGALIALGGLIFLTPSLWSMEPWGRTRLGFPPPRTWKGLPKDPTKGLWHRRGLLISACGVLAFVVPLAFWPSPPQPGPPQQAPEPNPYQLAILPILPADTSDLELRGFADDLTRRLIDFLRGFELLEVPTWRRVTGYDDPTLHPDTILSELGVRLFLAGTLTRYPDSFGIDFDLEDAESVGRPIRFTVATTGPEGDLSLAATVADQIISELRPEIGELIHDRELRLGTDVEEAYRNVVKAEEIRRNASGFAADGPQTGRMWAYRLADSLLAAASTLDPAWVEPLLRRGAFMQTWAFYGYRAASPGQEGRLDQDGCEALLLDGLGHLDEVLRLDPGNRDALYQRADLLLNWESICQRVFPPGRRDAVDMAEQDLLSAISGPRPHPDARGRLAVLKFNERRDFEAARNHGLAALEQDAFLDAREDVAYYLGLSLFELDDDQAGLERCSNMYDRGSLKFGAGRMLTECQLMIMAFGESVEPDLERAWALARENCVEDTDAVSEGALFLDERASIFMAGILARLQMGDSARAVLGRWRGPPGELLSERAAVLASLGDEEDALQLLSQFFQETNAEDPLTLLDSRALRGLRTLPGLDSLLSTAGSGGQ